MSHIWNEIDEYCLFYKRTSQSREKVPVFGPRNSALFPGFSKQKFCNILICLRDFRSVQFLIVDL